VHWRGPQDGWKVGHDALLGVDTPGVWSLDSLDTRHDATACNEFQSKPIQNRHLEGHGLKNEVQTSLVGRVRLRLRLASVGSSKLAVRHRHHAPFAHACPALSTSYTKSYISYVPCILLMILCTPLLYRSAFPHSCINPSGLPRSQQSALDIASSTDTSHSKTRRYTTRCLYPMTN
jgi:hypothetical protein